MTAAPEEQVDPAADQPETEPRPRWWQRRHERADDTAAASGPGAEVVLLRKTPAAPAAAPEPVPLTGVRAAVVAVADRPFPTRHSIRVAAKWWGPRLARLIARLPKLALFELAPILRGLGRIMKIWAAWRAVAEYAEAARQAEGSARASAAKAVEKQRTARTWVSIAVFVLWCIGWWIAWTWFTWWATAAAVLIVAGLDATGRAGRKKTDAPTVTALPAVLTGDIPLSQITRSILETFTREGFEDGSVRIARAMRWDPTRREYRLSLATADAIEQKHLDAIERAVGARDGAVRCLATDTAQVRELVIGIGDPLPGKRECDWIPTGSLTVTEPLPLGRSAGQTPMEVKFVGAHTVVVGRSRSGKTEGLLWTIIDRLAACRDVVLWGIDLQAGPAFPLWRGVIQKKAYTPDDAAALLAQVLAEMGRRKVILNDLAESDDPDDEDAGTVWTPDLGPYLFIPIDEFPLLAQFTGEKGRLDLLTPAEEIIRTGLKFGVHLILAAQKTGNSDFGSTVVQSQMSIKFLLACAEADILRLLSTKHRDSGWRPDLLQPAQDSGGSTTANDAGVCYISGPSHSTPDKYRADFWPKGSVKRRARQRIADGLPTLDGGAARADVIDEAVEIPQILVDLEAIFTHRRWPERLTTEQIVSALRAGGRPVPGGEDDLAAGGRWLSEELRKAKVDLRTRDTRWAVTPGANPQRGYYAEDLRAAIRGLA